MERYFLFFDDNTSIVKESKSISELLPEINYRLVEVRKYQPKEQWRTKAVIKNLLEDATQEVVLVARVDGGKVIVTENKTHYFSCVVCGKIIKSEHSCLQGERKCDHHFIDGVDFLGRPHDHACAAFLHANGSIVVLHNQEIFPAPEGWEMFQDKKTGGHGHHWYYYAKITSPSSIFSVAEALCGQKRDDESIEIEGDNTLVFKSPNPGVWIGKNGRWAKALKRLGIETKFVQTEDTRPKSGGPRLRRF